MWQSAVERERKAVEFQRIAEKSAETEGGGGEGRGGESGEALERKSSEFRKILEVSQEERDRVQRLQVIDRAAAAIAAARAILEEGGLSVPAEVARESGSGGFSGEGGGDGEGDRKGKWEIIEALIYSLFREFFLIIISCQLVKEIHLNSYNNSTFVFFGSEE